MVFIREDLNYAIHQVILCKLILAVNNLKPHHSIMSSYEYIKINKYSNLRQQLLAPILWEAQFLCIIQGQHPQSGWAHEGSYQPNQNGLNKKKNVSTFHHCQNYKIKKILSIFTRSRSSLLSFSLFSFSRVGPCKQGGPIANQNSERKLYIVFNTKNNKQKVSQYMNLL